MKILLLIHFFWILLLTSPFQASNTPEIYSKNNVVLPPGVQDRLAALSQTMTFIFLSKALVKDVLLVRSASPPVSRALNYTNILLMSLSDILLSKALLRNLLPRVSDQHDFESKLLAQYRIDSCNPWALVINLNHISDPLKTSISEILSVQGNDRVLINAMKPILEPFLSDDKGSIFSFKPSAKKSFKNYIYNFFTPFIQYEIETFICRLVRERTGVTVKSIKEINDLFECTSEHAFPSSKNTITSTIIYAKAPILKFTRKIKD